MSETLLIGAFLAALSYTLIPGPAFLALLGIGAGQGRKAGALFMGGHLAGDILWSTLALVAIVGARSVGTTIFDILGLFCGAYLGWIGWTALRARPAGENRALLTVERPLRRGLIFGLTNPKGYPVALATFTALLAGSANALEFDALPALLGVSLVGFLVADLILVAIIGPRWYDASIAATNWRSSGSPDSCSWALPSRRSGMPLPAFSACANLDGAPPATTFIFAAS